MIDAYFQYSDDLAHQIRSCYSPMGDLVWQIHKDFLESDEPEFGAYAAPSTTSNKIEVIREEQNELPFIEELDYKLFDTATVRTIAVIFEDFPNNASDSKAQLRVTEWENGEGFDFAFTGGIHADDFCLSLTRTRFEFMKKLVDTLN